MNLKVFKTTKDPDALKLIRNISEKIFKIESERELESMSSEYLEKAKECLVLNSERFNEFAAIFLCASTSLFPLKNVEAPSLLALLYERKNDYVMAIIYRKLGVITMFFQKAAAEDRSYNEFARGYFDDAKKRLSEYVAKVDSAIKSVSISNTVSFLGINDAIANIRKFISDLKKLNSDLDMFLAADSDDEFMALINACAKAGYSEDQVQKVINEIINFQPEKLAG